MFHYYAPPPYIAPRGQYKDYYVRSQFGEGLLPAYGGAPRQKGHGLVSFLGGLFKRAVPLLTNVGKHVVKTAGKALLSTGADVLGDVLSGQSVRSSILNRSKSTGKQLLKRAANATGEYISGSSGVSPPKRRATVKGTRRATTKKPKAKKKPTQRGQGRKKQSQGRKKQNRTPKVTLF